MTSMLLIAAAAAVLSTAPAMQSPAAASAPATATIRIVTAVRLKLDGSENPGIPKARDSIFRDANGADQHARVIEFQ